MIFWLVIILLLLCMIYTTRIFCFFSGLFKPRNGSNQTLYPISIIIPAKNEAENIGKCLDSILTQNYPAKKVEVIVIDDHSVDGTNSIVQKFAAIDSRIKLIHLTNNASRLSSKKRAIECGIQNSTHDIIFTTDADCIAPTGWLRGMMAYFEPRIGMVAGAVLFEENSSLFSRLQSLEFLGLISAGAASIAMERPIIANGANLAYRKSAFLQVNGYEGHRHLISGDDDLLMQKIARETNWKVTFAFNPSTFIVTSPAKNLTTFLNQRSRWASKGVHYQDHSLVIFLISTYFFYLMLLLTLPLSFFGYHLFWVPIICFFMKLLVDFMLVLKGCKLFGKIHLLKYFPLAEILQLPYIVYVGFAGFLGKFKWK